MPFVGREYERSMFSSTSSVPGSFRVVELYLLFEIRLTN